MTGMAYTFNGQPTICPWPSVYKEGGILYVSDTDLRSVLYKRELCIRFASTFIRKCTYAPRIGVNMSCVYTSSGYHRNIEEIRYQGEFKDAKGVIRIRKSKD